MAITFTVSGNYTLDESDGIQSGVDGTPTGSPRPDSDVTLSTLQTDAPDFYTYLFTTLGLSTTFPTANGVAESSTTLIHVTAPQNIGTLDLTDANGDSFLAADLVDSGLSTTDGDHIIYLVSGLNNSVVLGEYDSDGNGSLDSVAFAVYIKPDGALDTDVNAQLFSVTFTAIKHPTEGSTAAAYDDAVDLLQNVYVHASSSLQLNFDNMPSGANLFNDAAESASGGGIIVFGENPVINAGSTKYTNASDTIQTSQGGTGATIGVDNQMFNVGNGAYFTFVDDIKDDFFAGPGGTLTETEADYAKNMQYAGLIEATRASIDISQIQDQNNLAGMTITAYELSQAWQGVDLLSHRGEGSPVTIDAVTVYASDHTTVLESFANGSEANLSNTIGISITNGVASVTGLNNGEIVEWHTTSDHNQVLIQDTAGKFDLGGFGISSGSSQTQSLAGHAYVEDSGPAITPQAVPDDNNLFVSNVLNDSDSSSYTLVPGTDGQKSFTIVGPADSSGDFQWTYDDNTHTSITETYKGSDLFQLVVNSDGTYSVTMLGTLPGTDIGLSSTIIHAGGPANEVDVLASGPSGDFAEIVGNDGTANPLVNASHGFVGVDNGNLDNGESLTLSLHASNGDLIDFSELTVGTKSAGTSHYDYTLHMSDGSTVTVNNVEVGKNGTIDVKDPDSTDNVLIESVEIFKVDGNAIKIGLSGIHFITPPDDALLPFTVQLADGDNDTTTANFSVAIDGNNDGSFDATVNSAAILPTSPTSFATPGSFGTSDGMTTSHALGLLGTTDSMMSLNHMAHQDLFIG